MSSYTGQNHMNILLLYTALQNPKFVFFGVLCHFQHWTGHITTEGFCGKKKPVYTVGQGSVL